MRGFYLPNSTTNSKHKLPLLVYFHRGDFCVESVFSPLYHNYINSLDVMVNVVDVSVEYRLALEHPLPIAYEDSRTALKWWTKLIRAELKLPPILRLYMACLWRFVYLLSNGIDDLLFNPINDPKLRNLGCQKVLVFVDEKDTLYDRGRYYSMSLRKSGWKRAVKVLESHIDQRERR
ncbi:hypothetical protein ACFX11_034939 [Malus domestica]